MIADHNVLSLLRTVGVPYELRPTDLRNRLVLTSAAIANTVKRLEQMRLVGRIPDPVDKRSSWVRLTGDGIKVTEETIRAWNTVQEKIFADVDPQLAQQASDILRTILLAVGDDEPAAPVARWGRDARGHASAQRVLAGAGPADEEPGEPAALAQPPAHGVGVPDHLRGHLGDLRVARGNRAPGPPDHVVAAVCPHQETATAYRAGAACGQAAAGCRSPGRAVEAARRRAIRRRMCTVPGVA